MARGGALRTGLRPEGLGALRALVLGAVCVAALVLAAPALADEDVDVTPTGFLPAALTVTAGETIHFTNEAIFGVSVTSDDGVFDSGPVPPNGGFTMTLSVPGEHAYVSTGNPFLRGTIRVVTRKLGGAPGDTAETRIPTLPFPDDEPDDFAVDPRFGVTASISRILVGFAPGATVEQVNAALADADVTIVGGLPDLGVLLVAADATPWLQDPFEGLRASLGALRAHGEAIAWASMVTQVEPLAVPRRAEDALGSLWSWADPTGSGNWGLVGARFPQAWNLLEPIRRASPEVVTGVVDVGFEEHGDLPALSIQTQLCPRDGSGCRAVGNTPSDHSDHVAGIIGAAFDNRRRRSRRAPRARRACRAATRSRSSTGTRSRRSAAATRRTSPACTASTRRSSCST